MTLTQIRASDWRNLKYLGRGNSHALQLTPFTHLHSPLLPNPATAAHSAMDGPPLASLSLTHVRYDPRDIVSYISAHLALVPQALVIAYVSLIWGTREIEILLMFAGQMGCEAFNWLLKRYIKEERPTRMFIPLYIMPMFSGVVLCVSGCGGQ